MIHPNFVAAFAAADKLMGELYSLRYKYSVSTPIWEHVPAAQDLLEEIKRELRKAEAAAILREQMEVEDE